MQQIATWLQQPAGQRFLALEAEKVSQVLPRLFGHPLLILGEPNFVDAIAYNKPKIVVNPSVLPYADYVHLCSRQDKLAIASDSIDVIYIAHCLEFVLNPHELLREAYRALRGEGCLLIAIFNPWSMFGIYKFLTSKFSSNAFWQARFMSANQIKDWLSLLGFDIIDSFSFGFCFPSDEFRWIAKICQVGQFPIGSANLILACKRMQPMTPIKPRWSFKRLLTRGLEPSA